MSSVRSNEYLYQRGCKYKQRHADAAWALYACMAAYRKYGTSVFPYKCSFCIYWHVGHTDRKVRDFIQMLLGQRNDGFISCGVNVYPLRRKQG